MTIINNLSKSTVNKNSNFHVREDLNFFDDGNRFRGFDYKGLPITTLRADNTTYLCIRVDYLDNNFTYKEWAETEEYLLEDEFNGVPEIDLDKLIENCERIIVKVEEMNAKAEAEVIDMADVKERAVKHIEKIENAVNNAKSTNWWEKSDYELRRIKDYMSSLIKEKERLQNTDFDNLNNRQKKEWKERKFAGEWYIEQLMGLCK